MNAQSTHAPTDVSLLARRILAALVDTLCLVVVYTLLAYGLGAATNDYERRWTGVFFYVGIPLALLAYFVICEGATSRTPGKALCGLRVVRCPGEPCGWSAAIVRNAFRIVDGLPCVLPYLAGALALALTLDRRRLGDRIADTAVVRNRVPPTRDPTEVIHA